MGMAIGMTLGINAGVTASKGGGGATSGTITSVSDDGEARCVFHTSAAHGLEISSSVTTSEMTEPAYDASSSALFSVPTTTTFILDGGPTFVGTATGKWENVT